MNWFTPRADPRATFKTPITVEDVLNSRMIAYPFRLLQCCLVTDGGGALILVAAERARDFPQKPVYLLGTGESVETPMVSQMEDFTSSRAFRITGAKAFAEARTTHQEFYCTGLPRRVQRTSSQINIKMAVELSAGKSAYPARSRRILRRLTTHLYHAIAAGTSAEMLRNTEHRRVH